MLLALLLVTMTLAFSMTSTLLKSLAEIWDWGIVGIAATCAVIGYILNFFLLRHFELGVAAVLISVSQIIVLNLIAYFSRGETLSEIQMAGVACAILASVLVAGK